MERTRPDDGAPRTFEISLGTTLVKFVNIEHSDLFPRIQVEEMIQDPTVSVVIPEYFFPELESNAKNYHVHGSFEKRYNQPSTCGTTSRLWYAHALAKECERFEKTIAVVDIANTPQYLVAESFLHRSPSLASLLALVVGTGAYSVVAGLVTDVYWTFQRVNWADNDEGLADRKTIPSYEKLIYDLADARRLFAAKGILKLASQYPDTRILALYPEAHSLRIASYMQQYNLAKEFMYRPFVKSFHLDTSVRQWHYKRGHWTRFSHEAI